MLVINVAGCDAGSWKMDIWKNKSLDDGARTKSFLSG